MLKKGFAPVVLLLIGTVMVIVVGGLFLIHQNIINKSKSESTYQKSGQPTSLSLKKQPIQQSTEEKVIKAANEYVCEKLGQDFCEKYVSNDLSSNSIAADRSVYYLVYQVSMPQKGITTGFQITQRADLTKPKEIDFLPDCKIISECDFLPQSKIEAIVQADMNKYGIKSDRVQIDLKFENYGPETPSRWLINYSIPQEKTPQCKDFKMGGEVYMEIAALSGKVIKSEFDCSAPGI